MAETQSADSDFSDDDQSPLDISFNKAAEHLRKITNKLDNNQLLELYALYKQGTEGKCNIPKPGWMDGKGRKKWEAWKELGNMSQEKAKKKYVSMIEELDPSCIASTSKEAKMGPKELWVAVSSMRYSPEPELKENELSLLEAAREDRAERVSKLLQSNPKLRDEKDVDGLSALHWAADRDAVNALTAAIKGGCPVDAVDDCGQTALHYAAACGHSRAAKILIEAGASILVDEEDCTPLDIATDDDVIKILRGAK